MQLSSSGLELTKKAEGLRNRTYVDLAGIRTIGFGHRLLPGESFPNGIDETQAEELLAADLHAAEIAVDHLVMVPLAQGQFDALVDFAFNLGAGRLAASSLLNDLNAKKYDAASWKLLAWDHVGAREVAGLKARREAEFRLWTAPAPQQTVAA